MRSVNCNSTWASAPSITVSIVCKIPVSGFRLTQLPHVHYRILSVFSDSLPLPPLSVLQHPPERVSPFLLPPTHLHLPLLPCRVIYPNCSVPCLKLWTNHYSQSKFLVCMYMYMSRDYSILATPQLFEVHCRCSAHVICNICMFCTLHVDIIYVCMYIMH